MILINKPMILIKKLPLMAFLAIMMLLMSCASNSGINSVYNKHKRDADIAMSVPRWLAMSVLPADVKRDIKPLLRGMKKFKFLLDNGDGHNDVHLSEDFKSLSKKEGYAPYVTITQDDTHLDILALETDGVIKELIFYADDNETTFLLGVTGKINKENFLRELERTTSRDN